MEADSTTSVTYEGPEDNYELKICSSSENEINSCNTDKIILAASIQSNISLCSSSETKVNASSDSNETNSFSKNEGSENSFISLTDTESQGGLFDGGIYSCGDTEHEVKTSAFADSEDKVILSVKRENTTEKSRQKQIRKVEIRKERIKKEEEIRKREVKKRRKKEIKKRENSLGSSEFKLNSYKSVKFGRSLVSKYNTFSFRRGEGKLKTYSKADKNAHSFSKIEYGLSSCTEENKTGVIRKSEDKTSSLSTTEVEIIFCNDSEDKSNSCSGSEGKINFSGKSEVKAKVCSENTYSKTEINVPHSIENETNLFSKKEDKENLCNNNVNKSNLCIDIIEDKVNMCENAEINLNLSGNSEHGENSRSKIEDVISVCKNVEIITVSGDSEQEENSCSNIEDTGNSSNKSSDRLSSSNVDQDHSCESRSNNHDNISEAHVKKDSSFVKNDVTSDSNIPKVNSASFVTNFLSFKIWPMLGQLQRIINGSAGTTVDDVHALCIKLTHEGFFLHPTKWLLHRTFFKDNFKCPKCKCQLVPFEFRGRDLFSCINDLCKNVKPFKKLKLFSEFHLPIRDLLIALFHWAAPTSHNIVNCQLPLGESDVRYISFAVQEHCSRVMKKSPKLGGRGCEVEVGFLHHKTLIIIGAFCKKTKEVRLKATYKVNPYVDSVLTNWLCPDTTVITNHDSAIYNKCFNVINKSDIIINHYLKTLDAGLRTLFGTNNVRKDASQSVLDEVQWRHQYGSTPEQAFLSILCQLSSNAEQDFGKTIKASLIQENRLASEIAEVLLKLHKSDISFENVSCGNDAAVSKISSEKTSENIYDGNNSSTPLQTENQMQKLLKISKSKENFYKAVIESRETSKKKPPIETPMLNIGTLDNLSYNDVRTIVAIVRLISVMAWPLMGSLQHIISGAFNKPACIYNVQEWRTELTEAGFFNDPEKWLVENRFPPGNTLCNKCLNSVTYQFGETNFLVCSNSLCLNQQTFRRPKFFSSFGIPIKNLLIIVFHWTAQSSIDVIRKDIAVNKFELGHVFWFISNHISVVMQQDTKLGKIDQIVEVGTFSYADICILGAFDRETKEIRLKAINVYADSLFLSAIARILNIWLVPGTTVLTVLPLLNLCNNKIELVESEDRMMISKYLKALANHIFLKSRMINIILLQRLLDEVLWRQKYGNTPKAAFYNLLFQVSGESYVGYDELLAARSVSVIGKKSVEVREEKLYPEKYYLPTNAEPILKRPSDGCSSTQLAPSEEPLKVQEIDDSIIHDTSQLCVTLDEYYFARLMNIQNKPEPVHPAYTYKCHYCKEFLTGNITVMNHTVEHVVVQLKRYYNKKYFFCNNCFSEFFDQKKFEAHIKKVHVNKCSFTCIICSVAFSSFADLHLHMLLTHVPYEMPYSCPVCFFRSSLYTDICSHFKEVHTNEPHLLCPYCLKMCSPINKGEKVLFTTSFCQHILEHRARLNNIKCFSCSLQFLNYVDLYNHALKDHISFLDSKEAVPFLPRHMVLIPVENKVYSPALHPAVTYATLKQAEFLEGTRAAKRKSTTSQISFTGNADCTTKADDENCDSPTFPSLVLQLCAVNDITESGLESSISRYPIAGPFLCHECKSLIDKKHFLKYLKCHCGFSTYCAKAFTCHIMIKHSLVKKKTNSLFSLQPALLQTSATCSCSFSSKNGDVLASHLKSCNGVIKMTDTTFVPRKREKPVCGDMLIEYPNPGVHISGVCIKVNDALASASTSTVDQEILDTSHTDCRNLCSNVLIKSSHSENYADITGTGSSQFTVEGDEEPNNRMMEYPEVQLNLSGVCIKVKDALAQASCSTADDENLSFTFSFYPDSYK